MATHSTASADQVAGASHFIQSRLPWARWQLDSQGTFWNHLFHILENTHAIFIEHLQHANQWDGQSISISMKFSVLVYQPLDLVVLGHLKLKRASNYGHLTHLHVFLCWVQCIFFFFWHIVLFWWKMVIRIMMSTGNIFMHPAMISGNKKNWIKKKHDLRNVEINCHAQ